MKTNIFFLAVSIICTSWLYASMDHAYVTNPVQTDGFGSQFQTIIAAVVYAELMGKQFVYTPFQAMEHNYTEDSNFLAQKERFINFIGNFELNWPESNAQAMINYKRFFDINCVLCARSNALKKIKTIFRIGKSKPIDFEDGYFNIAIHIRRPNMHDNRVQGTDVESELFFKCLEALRVQYKNENPLFHLYSQGSAEQFVLFGAADVRFHLNESIEETFLGMVLADVLLISPSSFSYTAALLSDGDVYYVPFWHAPLPHWRSAEDLLKRNLVPAHLP